MRAIPRCLWPLCLALAFLPVAVSGATEGESFDALRAKMVHLIEMQLLLTGEQTGVTELDEEVAAALREVPRHAFVPEVLQPYAYADNPLPVGHDQNIASPFLVALMTQLARLEPSDIVFETGTGAGYHAAVLSRLAAKVYSVEVATATTAGRTMRPTTRSSSRKPSTTCPSR